LVMNYEFHQGDFTISTDPAKLDIHRIHQFLSEESYWAAGRKLAVVQQSIRSSLCFGVYHLEKQAGFARVVTDYCTFAWLCDVFILTEYRGLGLAKWLVKTIVDYPEFDHLRRFLLATKDAGSLYHDYGSFMPLNNPERWMERFNPDA